MGWQRAMGGAACQRNLPRVRASEHVAVGFVSPWVEDSLRSSPPKPGSRGHGLWLWARFPRGRTESWLALHSAASQERFEPVDVVVAVDHVLLAHERAEQGQVRLGAVDDGLVERALEPHQAFAAGLAVHDQLSDE